MSKKKKQKKKKIENSSKSIQNAVTIPAGGGTAESRILDWLDVYGVDRDSMPRDALSEITYYTCIKTNSEMLGKMPLKYYQKTKDGTIQPPMTETLRLLDLRPNEYMSATTLKSWWEMCCGRWGNAFTWIQREFKPDGRYGGKYIVKGFYPMHPKNVSVIIDDKGIFGTTGCVYYQYTNPDTGEQVILKNDDVLHFKGWLSNDGLMGMSIEDVLKANFDGSNAASSYENSLYKNGMTARLVLQYTGNFDDDRIQEIQRKYGDKLTGAKAAGKVIAIPAGLALTPLNMSMVDADFVNIRKYSALQICAAAGCKPSNICDYSNSKYASSEAEALAYLDIFSYRLKMYEDEINAKLLTPKEYKNGYRYKFNEKAVLRINSKEQAEIIGILMDHAVYTTNNSRDILDMPHVEGGDVPLINGSYMPITEAGAAYRTKKENSKEPETTEGGNDE